MLVSSVISPHDLSLYRSPYAVFLPLSPIGFVFPYCLLVSLFPALSFYISVRFPIVTHLPSLFLMVFSFALHVFILLPEDTVNVRKAETGRH
jgi:hypothetical protein